MKRLWTMFLAIVGLSSNAFADCYDVAVEAFDEEDVEASVDYCVDADLLELEKIRENYDGATVEEKYKMALRADQMADRLVSVGYGDIVLAAAICYVCGDGPNR